MRTACRRLPAIVLVAATLAAATACVPPPEVSCVGTSVTVHRDIRYRSVPPGTDPDLVSLDVHEPDLPEGCDRAPVAVWVHGGGWAVGDKANNTAAKAALLASEGWILVSVNYRLSPAVTYPTHNEDVAAAVSWVVDHAAEHGGDPGRVTLMGHSAGAGIVSSIATDEGYLRGVGLDLDDVDCVVSLDTEAYDVAAQSDSPLYRQAFGTDPAVWADASPLTHVAAGKGMPDAMVVTRGTPRRIALSTRFADAMSAAGSRTVLVNANPLTHEGVNDAVGAPGDTLVTPPLLEFLAGC